MTTADSAAGQGRSVAMATAAPRVAMVMIAALHDVMTTVARPAMVKRDVDRVATAIDARPAATTTAGRPAATTTGVRHRHRPRLLTSTSDSCRQARRSPR